MADKLHDRARNSMDSVGVSGGGHSSAGVSQFSSLSSLISSNLLLLADMHLEAQELTANKQMYKQTISGTPTTSFLKRLDSYTKLTSFFVSQSEYQHQMQEEGKSKVYICIYMTKKQ